MAYNQYSGYGGNPYGTEQQSEGYGATPHGSEQQSGGYGYANPYQTSHDTYQTGGVAQAQNFNSPAPAMPGHPVQPGQHVEYVRPGPSVLSNADFLSRVEAVKADIRTLTTHVGQIASMHQRTLSSPDSGSSAQLESMITQTQVLNTSIKDQIKHLETDAVRSKDNNVKNTQVGQLKTSFAKQLQEYRVEESNYEKRYREQIARQYRIVNPDATDSEVHEATQADWGNEGVFQTALKSNRSATANTVLGAVRARHNDIKKIEQTMTELSQLMDDLATAIVLQDEGIKQFEDQTTAVATDMEAGNDKLNSGIDSARRARKLKWIALGIVVLIIVALVLILALYFTLNKNH